MTYKIGDSGHFRSHIGGLIAQLEVMEADLRRAVSNKTNKETP